MFWLKISKWVWGAITAWMQIILIKCTYAWDLLIGYIIAIWYQCLLILNCLMSWNILRNLPHMSGRFWKKNCPFLHNIRLCWWCWNVMIWHCYWKLWHAIQSRWQLTLRIIQELFITRLLNCLINSWSIIHTLEWMFFI